MIEKCKNIIKEKLFSIILTIIVLLMLLAFFVTVYVIKNIEVKTINNTGITLLDNGKKIKKEVSPTTGEIITTVIDENGEVEAVINEDGKVINKNDNNKSTETKREGATNDTTTKQGSTPITNNNSTQKTDAKVTTDSTPTTPTLKEQNTKLINDIKRIYGYNVSYGVEEFWYGGQASKQITDEAAANNALTKLKSESSKFPSGFFRTFQGYNGYRILLFDHIYGAAGVASYEFGDDNYLALDINNGYLGRVFYHETYHIMDQYIRYKSYSSGFPFNNWSVYNPPGFAYGQTGTQFTGYDLNEYGQYTTPSNIAFVSEYAKSKPQEDRAELFADLMFRGYKKPYMYSGYGINEKAKELATVIRNYFPNSAGAMWERYISW